MKFIHVERDRWEEGRGYRKQRLLGAEALRSAGTLVQIVTMAPGEVIPPHVHRTSVEVYYVLRGECELEVNGERHPLCAGDLLLMEPGDVHALANGDEPFELLVFKTNAGVGDTEWEGV